MCIMADQTPHSKLTLKGSPLVEAPRKTSRGRGFEAQATAPNKRDEGYSSEKSRYPACLGSCGEEESLGEEMLPNFEYYIDESDPDVVVLRRQDGAFVAAFSAIGVTEEAIVVAAKEDYRALLKERASSLGLNESEDQDPKKDA
jgi:hypothetical protein